MKTEKREEKIAALVAEMTAITEFALGSVKPNRKKHTVKDGSVRETKTQYLFQSRGGRGKRQCRHIPSALVPQVRKRVEAGRKYEKLEAEYKRLVTEEALEGLKKRQTTDSADAAARERRGTDQ